MHQILNRPALGRGTAPFVMETTIPQSSEWHGVRKTNRWTPFESGRRLHGGTNRTPMYILAITDQEAALKCRPGFMEGFFHPLILGLRNQVAGGSTVVQRRRQSVQRFDAFERL